MNTISYAASSHLRESLQRIDVLHGNILLSVLTQEKELRLRWQMAVERVYWSFALSETPLEKNEIAKLFKKPLEKQLTSLQKKTLACKKGFDYITQEWLGSQEPVSAKTVLSLHQIACEGRLRISQESLASSLLYFQNSSEHPVIQAGLIFIQTLSLSPFTKDNDKISRLLSYLFLYKEGFYCRGFLVLEEYFKKNLIEYQQILEQAKRAGTQTLWLEYFAKAVESTLEKILENISANKTRTETPASMFKLNERQKEILVLLENPEITITNRQIQKMFKTSAITASRDLAKLTTLGLLFIHGKGRSVYYTKI
jgi:hypothetical protein